MTVTDCPTCGQQLAERQPPPCDAIHPATAHDVLPVRCELPKGHRSEEHWHRPLLPGHRHVEWYDNDEVLR